MDKHAENCLRFMIKYYTVEKVVGNISKETANILSKFNIEYSGSGSVVVEQSPKAGGKLEEESTVGLMLGN